MTDAVAISAGYSISLVLTADGSLGCSGGGTVWGACEIPPDIVDVVAISMGFGFGLAVRSDGTIACWGKKNNGECNVPPGLRNVIAVAGGYNHGLALKADGSVAAWGGDGKWPALNRVVPPGLGKLTAIDTNGNESRMVNIGLRQDGTVVVWSKPRYGAVYRVSTGLEKSIAIDSGWYHYLALGEDGSVQAWGDNSSGQCDVPDELQ
jgi:alpha-tubulin suppressor-like RCC1 family protein